MNRSDKPQPRPLLGLALLLGTLNGLTSDGVDAEFRGLSGVLLMAGIVTAVPGAAAAWAGWRLLTR